MLFDDLFREIGEFGRYQILIYCMLGLVGIPTGWQNMAITFIGADMPSWCRIEELQNLTAQQQREVAIPTKGDTFDRCYYFNLNYSSYSSHELENWNRSIMIDEENTPRLPCNGYVYDTSVFTSTVGSQWDLVCEKQFMISLVQTIYMTGFLTGCIGFGQISDMIGRRKALLIALVLEVLFAFAATFCPIYPLYCVLRFAVGVAAAGAFTTVFVLTMEIIGPRYRMGAGIFIQGWFAGGLMTYPFMSYAIRNHIHLQVLASSLTVLLWGLYFVVPESPRWLVTHGHDEEAEDIMRKLAKGNNRPCPEPLNICDNRQYEVGDAKASVIDLWRGKKIRKITANMWFCWFVASLSYYGLSLGVDFLQGSLFFNSFLSGLVEIPAYIIIVLIMDRTGRKWPTVITFMLSAIFCIACMPLFNYPNLSTLLTTFLMLGKCAVAGCFAIMYVYAAELFPTVVRNVGVGSSSMCARLAGLLQPQVALTRTVWEPLPFLVYGATSFIAGLSSFILPETLGKKLPETLEEVENVDKVDPEKEVGAPIEEFTYGSPVQNDLLTTRM